MLNTSRSCSSLDASIASESSFGALSRNPSISIGVQNRSFLGASTLKKQLISFDISSWKDKVTTLAVIGGAALSANANLLQPSGPGGCDHSPLDRCCNCVTSVPIVLVGAHAVRQRKTKVGKWWGASLIGVGAASCAFHASSGSLRPYTRKLDFWSISASSSLMVKAVHPKTPNALTTLGLLLTPFKPFWVSFANSILMEAKFIQRAKADPSLRPYQKLHAVTSLVGLGCYVLEDHFPNLPLVHSAWHCLSAASLCTVNNLVDNVEGNELSIGQELSRELSHMPVQCLQVEQPLCLAC
eukprot:gene2796-12671_t